MSLLPSFKPPVGCKAINQATKIHVTLFFTFHSFLLQAVRTITEILKVNWKQRSISNGPHALQHVSGDLRNRNQISTQRKNVTFTMIETKLK